MSEAISKRYFRLLVAGETAACIKIEKEHGLYGLPPEMVHCELQRLDKLDPMGDAIRENAK